MMKNSQPTESTYAPGSIRYLRPQQVAAMFGLSVKYLANARITGEGPPFFKPRRKMVLYRLDEVQAWIEAARRTSTSDDGTAAE